MKKWKDKLLPILAVVITLVCALFWVALRINHSGISKFLGADTNPSFLVMNLPVMVTALAWVGAGMALAGLVSRRPQRWLSITALVIGVVMAIAAGVVIAFGAKDYMRFILVHFYRSVAVTGLLAVFALALFCPVSGHRGIKALLLAAVTALAVILGYGWKFCCFQDGPVVYAVEDTYQIVFSTTDSAIAWVQVGQECYYDLYAGSMRSAKTVHKIELPQKILDTAGGYTVHAQQMIYRGPFGGYKGKVISQSYSFRGVSDQGSLAYYALSDVHQAKEAAIRAASGEKIDFLVLAGDLISMVETDTDVRFTNELAHAITGGEIPVVYARGNHEIKGEQGEEFYRYVGSRNQEYFYWFTLGSRVFGVVLDLGEDHEDDWWEYYGTAQFDLYRSRQSDMLRQLLQSEVYKNYDYRLAVCHIPVVHVNKHGYFESFKLEWTELLNAMEFDMCISGHEHELWPLLPEMYTPYEKLVYSDAFTGVSGKREDGYLTDFRFPNLLAGRQGATQLGTSAGNASDYTCLFIRVDFAANQQTAYYVNSDGQELAGEYPFAPGGSFSRIVLKLSGKK